MILKNLRHRLRLIANNCKLMWRYDVLIEKAVTTKYVDSIRIGRHCTLQSGVYIYGSRTDNVIALGDHVVISMGCTLLGEGGLSIGDFTHVGPRVTITSQFGDSRSNMTSPDVKLKTLPVRIGKGCWLGASSVIMPGSDLGDCCIVAPGAVVFGKWGQGTKLGGNPARPIKT